MLRVIPVVVLLAAGTGCGAGAEKPQWEWQKNAAAAKKFTCSDLTEKRWKKLRSSDPPPRALTGFAIKLRSCGRLNGESREDLYAFLGYPDRAGKMYASWIVGYDHMFGDEVTLTAVMRQDKVKNFEKV